MTDIDRLNVFVNGTIPERQQAQKDLEVLIKSGVVRPEIQQLYSHLLLLQIDTPVLLRQSEARLVISENSLSITELTGVELGIENLPSKKSRRFPNKK